MSVLNPNPEPLAPGQNPSPAVINTRDDYLALPDQKNTYCKLYDSCLDHCIASDWAQFVCTSCEKVGDKMEIELPKVCGISANTSVFQQIETNQADEGWDFSP